MNTLLFGTQIEPRTILHHALIARRHQVIEATTTENAVTLLQENGIQLIVLSECNDETLQFCRTVRALNSGSVFAIIMALSKDHSYRFNELLEAGADQCIVESLHDEQRLDIRLAFAEKLAHEKLQREIVEQKLRESEARSRSILETTVDAIITIDDRANIKTFNSTAQTLFGYSLDEVVGKNIRMLMPEPFKREHDDYMHNYLETGKRKIIGIGREVTGLRKDGTTFPMYLAVSEVQIRGQRIFTGIVRDISEQRRLELEVLRISEYERRRIGQDLHDGLGQMLTGIGLISQNVAKTLHKSEHPSAEQVDEITKLIRESDQYARELARGLIPVEFDSQGLTAALARLANQARKLFNIDCVFDSAFDVRLDDVTNIVHLYRIAQEAVSNAVKHGNSTKVEIKLYGSDDYLRLRISDNGQGFSEQWDQKGGLGVRIMQFRARLIGANLEIGATPDSGAIVTCTLPLAGIGILEVSSPNNE